MSGLGGKVAIIGTRTIKFGENFHQSFTDMIFEAVNLAMADAKIESRQLQAGWLGCNEPMFYGFEGNSGTFVSDSLNLIHDQLLGRVGKIQVQGADMGPAHALGGPGAVSAETVLSQP
jgi:acetyl-CoA acetyltransferase